MMPDEQVEPTDASRIAQIAAHESWAKTGDRSSRTAPARRAMLARFEREVDPDGTMDPGEREAKALEARRAHFSEMAKRPRKARKAKAAATAEDHGEIAADLRLQRDEEKRALYDFLMERLTEELVGIATETVQQSRERRVDEVNARAALIRRLRQDGLDEYLRFLVVPYRDYPDCRANWLL